jgi:hypothetical protein
VAWPQGLLCISSQEQKLAEEAKSQENEEAEREKIHDLDKELTTGVDVEEEDVTGENE